MKQNIDSLLGNRLHLAKEIGEILKRELALETNTCSCHDHNVNFARHLSVVVHV